MCPSKYYFKKHKNMDQKVFEGYNLAWLQKKGHLWGNWIQMAKHKGTFLLCLHPKNPWSQLLVSVEIPNLVKVNNI